jgi:hypothetical protein
MKGLKDDEKDESDDEQHRNRHQNKDPNKAPTHLGWRVASGFFFSGFISFMSTSFRIHTLHYETTPKENDRNRFAIA